MKSNAENLRLFKEARLLKENLRSGLRNKATNQTENRAGPPQEPKVKMLGKENQN